MGKCGGSAGNAALHGTSAIFRMDLIIGVSELKAANTICVAYFVATGCEIICCSIPIHFCRIWQCKIRQNTHDSMKHHETELPLHLESLSFVFWWKESWTHCSVPWP